MRRVPGGLRTGVRLRGAVAPLTSTLLVLLVTCAVSAVRGRYPFGPLSRADRDLGQQFVPMLAHARDVLTGHADGGLLFSWQSAFGTPFLADALAYVGGTTSWIALLLPRHLVDLALFLGLLVDVGAAAGLMTLLLRHLRPGAPAWLTVAGGVAYGASAWPMELGYMATWVTGLAAFPALALVLDRLRVRPTPGRAVTAVLVVALFWLGHFYTAYMATLGAAVLLLVLALAEPGGGAGDRLRGLLRPAGAVLVSLALLAPVLVPAQHLVGQATPSPGIGFHPDTPRVLLARLLPASAGVAGTPALHVGILLLVLALGLVANGALARRERLVWAVGLVLVVASVQWGPTHLAWHAFDTPNGNPYRQAFVLAGLLVVAGFLSAAAGLGRVPVLVGGAGVAVVAVLTARAQDTSAATLPLTAGALVLVLVALLAARSLRGRRAALVGALLVGVTALELTASGVVVDAHRAAALGQLPTWSGRQERAMAKVGAVDDWPRSRTDPGGTITVNDPMLLGGQGSEYYSSTIPAGTTRLLVGLGWGYSAYGRALVDPADPVTDAIFSVRHRLENPPPGSTRRTSAMVARTATGPLVSLRRGGPASAGDTVWSRREALLGTPVYEVPEVRIALPSGVREAPGRGERVFLAAAAGGALRVSARCTPGSAVYLSSPALVGQYSVDGAWRGALPLRAVQPGRYSGMAVRPVGSAGVDGTVSLGLRMTSRTLHLADAPLACLPAGALARAVAALVPAGRVDVGARSVTFDVTGAGPSTSVLAVPLVEGWSCTGAVRAPGVRSWDGLLAVDTRPGRVSCSWTPPRAGAGLVGGLLGVLALVLLALEARRAARRRSGRVRERRVG